jgi:rRNA maturation RNase YbeY
MKLLRLFNRQKSRSVNLALLRRIAKNLIEELLAHEGYELGVHLVGALEMAGVNEKFLGHSGSTDVITFNYQDTETGANLHGEIFISVDDAVQQAGQFRTTWQSEIVRYVAHGILHLEGYDDAKPGPRRVLKREENKLVKALSARFEFDKVGRVKNASKYK